MRNRIPVTRAAARRRVAGLAIVLLVILALWTVAFILQYVYWGPMYGTTDHSQWYHGLAHGYFILGNLIVNVFSSNDARTIFQPGGSGWYDFWFFIGIVIAVGTSKATNSR